jgi:hypothetical protein
MPRIAANPSHARVPRGDGRELVVFESIVALFALLLIISGFSLYIGKAFTAPDAPVSGGAVRVSAQTTVEIPLSLAET